MYVNKVNRVNPLKYLSVLQWRKTKDMYKENKTVIQRIHQDTINQHVIILTIYNEEGYRHDLKINGNQISQMLTNQRPPWELATACVG